MNYTDNFNLGLPLVTEKYDVNVFNTNNTIIDETLTHVNEKTNPHEVTAAQIGLGNVDNTSDATKPVSTPQAQAIAQAVAAEETRARAAEEANANAIANIEGMIPDIATTTTPGIVKPDGTTITVEDDGTISAVQATIDDALSTTSTNAVQNAVVTTALNAKADQSTTYTKTEVDNLMSAFETNIDWKESVATYADIATTYPNPVDGWTVNVKDTDYTYRYNGTSWIYISANAIPDATTSVKGLMTTDMVTKLNGIEAGAQVNTVTGVKGGAESTYRTGDINITKSDIGLDNVPNVTTNDQTPTFTQASTRTNIVSGETLSILFGKIMKFFNDLKTVAFSGSYDDLTQKPTIGNANLTIQKNGVTVNTFSANATENVSANITVPTKTSELTNDSGFITSENVGVTGVKGSSESTYRTGDVNITAANIGLGNVGNYKAVSTVANQGLTNQEKIDARTNIGAGTSNFSGDYDDLRNKPTIPTVNNATLTIQKNGSTVKTFTANASENVTANITVPTKTSEITNDSGYITSADIAVTGVKGNSESTYRTGNVNITAANIGLGNVGNYKAVSTAANQGLTDNEKANARANIGAGTSSFSGSYTDLTDKPTIPTVNNATLTIQKNGANVQTFTANQASNATANITVPTKTSELTNDSGFITSASVGVTKVSTGTGLKGGDITSTGTISTNVPRVAKDSKSLPGTNSWILEEYTAGTNYNLPSNAWYHIYSAKGTDAAYGTQLALGMTTNAAYYRNYNNGTWGSWQSLINTWRGIQNNLTSDSETESLSAAQGKVLKGLIDAKGTGTVTQVKVGNTAYNPTSGVVELPAYPTDTNTHRPIQVNGTEILGNNTTPLNLKQGNNVTISNSSGTVTIAASNTTYDVVSTSANGLAPKVTDTSKYLRGDGTWATPTNTLNTAGSTDTSSKIFLIGATSQAANPQTYSHDTAYVGTDGCLYSGGAKVLTAHDGNNRKSFYGTCSTDAGTAAKVVTLAESAGWPGLVAGVIVGVKFTNTNTYSNVTTSPITLNVNSAGAKNIWYASTHSGAGNTGANTTAYGRANYINYYMYDGTYWVWMSSSVDNNTTYTAATAAPGDITTGTASAGSSGNYARQDHTHKIATATTSAYGATKLNDATNSTSTTEAATANAVKKAYDLAASKTSNTGTVTSVATGTGLTGGPITTSGTISLASGVVTAGSAGPTDNVTGTEGTTISVPRITVDTYGRVTALTSYTLTNKNSTYTVNNGTLTIKQNGTSKGTFTANQSGNSEANIITDTWTSTATVSSSGTVAFSGLDDSYGYDLYCQNKLLTIKSVAKSGSGTSTTLTYTVDGAATGDVCKLRILK